MSTLAHGSARRGKKTSTYYSWQHMRGRCLDRDNPDYLDYGGRGITIDPRWDWFENFLDDMGEKPDDMTLDRIDNDGNYCKDNCQWATQSQQARNRSSTIMTFDGAVDVICRVIRGTDTRRELEAEYGMSISGMHNILHQNSWKDAYPAALKILASELKLNGDECHHS